jgi:UDP-2,4-diacetamido-2,4,6-trideoxy-beta-L-altropyranose hydrolase
MNAGKTLLIRADASTQIGTGHVMRCLALAQAWQERGGAARFVSADLAPTLEARFAAEGMGLSYLDVPPGTASDAAQTAALARKYGADWLVVDGYHFGAAYQRTIKDASLQLLFIDDNGHAGTYYADILLNQNIYADESLYANREPYTALLLGPQYALLRREFWPWRGWQREIAPVAHKILVTLGGSDPDNVTRKAIRALQQVDVAGVEAAIIVGASNPHYQELQAAVTACPIGVRLECNAPNMPEIMSWADIAVSAGGSTCWEMAFMGVPAILLVLADNQRSNAQELHARGIGRNLGWHERVTPAHLAEALLQLSAAGTSRATMARLGQELVDGQGARRVIAAMLANAYMRVRPARTDDIHLLFEWANDPVTRQMSFSSVPISWEEHEKWYHNVLAEPDVVLMIVETQERGIWLPVGQVRIDGEGKLSFALAPEHRGRHLAAPVLRMAVEYYVSRYSRGLIAYVKAENRSSQKAFIRAGFELLGWTNVAAQPCLKYSYPPQADAERSRAIGGNAHVQNQ